MSSSNLAATEPAKTHTKKNTKMTKNMFSVVLFVMDQLILGVEDLHRQLDGFNNR